MVKWYSSGFFGCIGIFLVLIGMGSCIKMGNGRESLTDTSYAEKLRHERIMAGCQTEE